VSLDLTISLQINRSVQYIAALIPMVSRRIVDDDRIVGSTLGESSVVVMASPSRENWDVSRDVFGIEHSIRVFVLINKEQAAAEVCQFLELVPTLYRASKAGGIVHYLDNTLTRWREEVVQVSESSHYKEAILRILVDHDPRMLISEVDFERM
jgi:hypothetical protein